ncbi:MAG: SPASM domain-containing protein [Cryomorphaceae bacterium]|jgi:radical SAM protein with 4Fe4S-binding SPASM domain|nr:SPASM domain-containing protein [Cryomorphaceae bacterium]
MSKWRDLWQIARTIGRGRLINLILLWSSFYLSKISKRPILWGEPFSLSIEPTTACNLGCPECPSGLKQFTRPTGKLDLNLHSEILQHVKRHVFYINYYFQGEPFLHPQFLELIKEAKKIGVYTATSTNAHFIDQQKAKEIIESGLDRLIISIDGLSQETYENYRIHGSLNKVLEASKHLIAAKKASSSKTPHLIFQFLVVRQNEHEVPAVLALGKELGIDEVRMKTAQFYSYENGNELMPKNTEYSRYKLQKNGKYKLKYSTKNECWRMWSSSVITWDGRVVPCCFDKDATHQLGQLGETDFAAIWRSNAYQSFRRNILTGRNSIDICKNCSEGAKVWV